MNLMNRAWRSVRPQRGATLVEFVVVAPTMLVLALATMQAGMVFHAKSSLNYATFEAARAGAVHHAQLSDITQALTRALVPYYGGGTSVSELAQSYARAAADLASGAVRIEIISPTKESFDDYASPELAARLKISNRVIPNGNLGLLTCPQDRPGCNSNPQSNASGQSMADANLLKIRVTYGIPQNKQMPLVGRFYTWALSILDAGDPDAYRLGLIQAGRIPIISHIVLRMQSEPIESSSMVSIPGPGNNGTPTDPGPPYSGGGELPDCPASDPTCTQEPDPGDGDSDVPVPLCDPATDPTCSDTPPCTYSGGSGG